MLELQVKDKSTLFYLLDYVTQTEIFQIGDRKKKKKKNHQRQVNRNFLVYIDKLQLKQNIHKTS